MRRPALLPTALLCAGLSAAPAPKPPRPLIQVALLLDTSNSMDGLIGQAKSQLWTFVNEFAPLKRDGAAPELQVALYEYGKSSIPAGEGHLRMVLPFTTDLDKVSEQLFALATRGGDEYCGTVLRAAAEGLAWSREPRDLRVVFIAGNEPFTQGGTDYKKSCKEAITKGIVVNTVFCGSKQEGIDTSWKDGADLADGRYMNIDQNYKPPEITAPQDAEITKLGQELNKTYIAYGATGKAGSARQLEMDEKAAAAAPSANVQRQAAKSTQYYSNASWDLVDAKKEGAVDLDKMDAKDMPAEMQKMTPAERKAYVEKKAKERAEIQAKIKKLNDERNKYVAEEMKKAAGAGASTLDQAVINAVRDEAQAKGYKFQ
jgi:hypothetical protein